MTPMERGKCKGRKMKGGGGGREMGGEKENREEGGVGCPPVASYAPPWGPLTDPPSLYDPLLIDLDPDPEPYPYSSLA